ncbi:Rv2231c family pyridoxal phosphate-dependent protein CobC [Blastococcus litoris]|uniref:Rv2231c family pyridoxal phosphate-dependent protein CobC n=1 Tax=Blastococcus litoris TaxID=2171622 RepID=UPI0013DFCDF7|nr:Rv2231c family pyridoxal phosphate-dependent protein CobC [Blastococcus litoris]
MTDLRHHGDAEVGPGLVDLAVNVRADAPPAWLRAVLHDALDRSAAYPDAGPARAAVAAAHGRDPAEVLLTAGAAETFTLVARALAPRRAVVVHPSFTEPEAALRAAGHPVQRLLLRAEDGYRLDPDAVPDDADLVVLGNPTNPTSVLHPAALVAKLVRPGRLVVVDEAFADTVPGEPESLAGLADLSGLLVVRSLTKTWGLAGLRVGYALGAPDLVAALAAQQPHWPVSTPALAALTACSTPAARAEAEAGARDLAADRAALLAALPTGVVVEGRPESSFVLLRVPGGARVRERLRDLGWAVRRGDTFPGLTSDHLRVAVRDPGTSRAFAAALTDVLGGRPGSSAPGRPGRVVLVGGGPGDPGLLTVRGRQALAEADVVVADHLAPQEVLSWLAPHVEVVDASKLPRGRAMAQERINGLLVEHARAGRRVVRLKGGDPFVFGRGMEEVEACTAAGVPVEVVPGVTSAVAVPALAGVPVTHRGLTHEFVVVSGHVPPDHPSSLVDWAALGRLRGTLVVLMGVETAPAIAAALVAHGRAPDTPVAVVVEGASDRQRVLRTTLDGLAATMAREAVRPPAVWVVGDVVDLTAA